MIEENGLHIYKCADGKKVNSVTYYLKVLGSESIVKWSNYLGFNHRKYEDELEYAADVGSQVHESLHAYLDKSYKPHTIISDSFAEEMSEMAIMNLKSLFRDIPYETIYTEKEFASSKLGYGGTIDWYVKIGSRKFLGDFKTSKRVYNKHLLQLGGYYNLMKEAGEEPDGAFILRLKGLDRKIFFVSVDQLKYLGEIFNFLVKYSNFLRAESESELPQDKTITLESFRTKG